MRTTFLARLIADAYAGPTRTLLLPEADHHTPMNDEQSEQYAEQLDWLFGGSGLDILLHGERSFQ